MTTNRKKTTTTRIVSEVEVPPHIRKIMQRGDEKEAGRLVKFIEKYYYQQSNKWLEQTTRREIPEDEVPPYIRNKYIRNNVGRID
ncbi:MAG: hypothetical protein J6V89_05875 [Acetobacter sp.]|nr:hypothetical protein [Acetobacter sp.]